MRDVVGFEVERARRIGEEAPCFLVLHRYELHNVYADGGRSASYLCDFVQRPRGLDAVAVVLYRRGPDGAEVLLRGQLRPPLQLGRRAGDVALAAPPRPLLNPEIVAGLLEAEDRGEAGVQRRAAIEAHEEAGYRVDPSSVVLLGAASFPTPGAFPEQFVFAACDVTGLVAEPPPSDGHPLEEGAWLRWLPLDEAIDACVRGEIADCKTEIALRRLRDRQR